ncbi:TVP38/TMEM64 family protein [Pararhodospirillum oryzae]|uniref:TVP38/TMEM64 family membrane protein n=1 Tax=Pararhodospirillum oryzae TaxID=478448 RepID=A0A512H4C4_9PROT|nr:VTT domain-containing protein [Pararhodospirillum oryzae]GEO80319.1 hypothetical protein ROR02_04500 [Pararhodospirillum oryzae]
MSPWSSGVALARRKRWAFALVLAGMAAATVWAWGGTGAGALLDPVRLAALAAPWLAHPLAPVAAVGAIVALGLVGFPVTVLILAVGLAFPPAVALIVNAAGLMASAVVLFVAGRGLRRWLRVSPVLGREPESPVLGREPESPGKGRGQEPSGKRRWRGLALAEGGAAGVAALRNIPVVPFSILSVLYGASPIGWRVYLLGTAVGMAPGVVALSLLGERLAATVRHPDGWSIGALVLTAGLTAWGAHAAQRWAEKRPGRAGE